MKMSYIICAVSLLLSFSIFSQSVDFNQEVIDRFAKLREIKASKDEKKLDEYNKAMDEIWTFFEEHKTQVLPVIASQLDKECSKEKPNDLILLDMGYYLYIEKEYSSQFKDIAKRALYTLNPESKIIKANHSQLFYFTHVVAQDRDSLVLEFIDRAFLYPKERIAFVPQHAMSLGRDQQCLFLYGVYGEGAEEHLLEKLSDTKVRNSVLSVLAWIGTSKSFSAVDQFLTTQRDYESFIPLIAYMLQIRGPEGITMLLELKPNEFDSKSKEFLKLFQENSKEFNYESLSEFLDNNEGDKELSDEEVKLRLKAMYDNYGKDYETNPLAILNCTLPKDYLIDQLQKIRTRMLFRVSDEGLIDVDVTNRIITLLQFER